MSDVLPEALSRGPHARALAVAAAATAAVLAAIAASALIWALLGFADDPLPAPAPIAAEALAEQAEARSGSGIAQWHLFGNATPRRDTRALADAPDTGLDLTLRGVFAADDPAAGRAIIGDSNGQDRSFSVGDTVGDGVTLDGIYPDRVVLMRNGVREALRLPRERSVATTNTRGGRPNYSISPGPVPNLRAPGASSPLPGTSGAAAPGTPEPFVNPVMSMGTVDYERAKATLGVDPAELARSVSVLPVLENGRFVGVRLSGGANVPALAQLGLRPDDVVTMVNGIALDSPARATEVAQNLASATTVNVTVRRDGRTENLSVSLR